MLLTDDYADNDSDSEGRSSSAAAEVCIIKTSQDSHTISHTLSAAHELTKPILALMRCFIYCNRSG